MDGSLESMLVGTDVGINGLFQSYIALIKVSLVHFFLRLICMERAYYFTRYD